jgi:Tfp pilus assembly protein PilN
MKPVNLLPESSRPRVASGRFSGSAYAIVGGLGLVLVMAVLYVLSGNSVNSKRSDIESAKAETQAAEQRAGSYSAFTNFSQITQAREQTVRSLATVRFDWERVMREVSRVVPSNIWLLGVNASVNTQSESGSSPTAAASSGTSGSTDGTTPGSPTLAVNGCAPSQTSVAGLLVRLRQMDRVDDVSLGESAKADDSGGSTAGGASDSAGSGEGTCPTSRYRFSANVTFKTPQPGSQSSEGNVPASLGGGQ